MYINKEIEKEDLSVVKKDILKTLLYFNVFRYPLTYEEIFFNSESNQLTRFELKNSLDELVKDGIIGKQNVFYFIGNDSSIIPRRMRGNIKAKKSIKKARRMGNLISHFPFVRAVCISGSLSKSYMDEKSDFDFFVVTIPGRLWLVRTLLILFKKIFLLNSSKLLCINYLIDTEHLLIHEQNIFTARELNHLIPVYNQEVYNRLLNTNTWISLYMPNFPRRNSEEIHQRKPVKHFLEYLFGGKAGENLDDITMHLTEKHWRKKFREKFRSGIDIRCTKHVSKFHLGGNQNKVLDKYHEAITNFELFYNVHILS